MTDQSDAQFGIPGCTCIPWTRQDGATRYCQPGDTVDKISGWERGGDCPHHTAAPADLRQQYAAALHGCGRLTDGDAGTLADLDDLHDLDILAAAVLAVRDRELEQLRQRLALADHIHQENAAAIERFRARIQSAADEARGSMRDWLVDALADSADPREPSTAQTFREQAARAKAALERVQAECDRLRASAVLADGEPHTDRERGIVAAVTRVLAALNPQERPAGHQYLSTGCLHDRHDYCQSMTGLAGAKRPAECKFCQAACICPCHTQPPASA